MIIQEPADKTVATLTGRVSKRERKLAGTPAETVWLIDTLSGLERNTANAR